MIRRCLSAVVGAAIGLVVGFFGACGIVLVGAAVFWLWIFGDDPWPPAANTVLVALGGLVWIAAIATGAVAGWHRERAPHR